jgi:hypothetical protein
MITAAFILAPAAVVGLGAFVVMLFDKAHRRRRRLALLNKAQGLGR